MVSLEKENRSTLFTRFNVVIFGKREEAFLIHNEIVDSIEKKSVDKGILQLIEDARSSNEGWRETTTRFLSRIGDKNENLKLRKVDSDIFIFPID